MSDTDVLTAEPAVNPGKQMLVLGGGYTGQRFARAAAARGELQTPEQVEAQVRRMSADRRALSKLHTFLLTWLRVDRPAEIAKDPSRHSGFDAAVVSDLRTSLRLLLDDIVLPAAGPADYRRLFTADEVPINGETVNGVALWSRANNLPSGDERRDEPDLIESLPDGDGLGTRTE